MTSYLMKAKLSNLTFRVLNNPAPITYSTQPSFPTIPTSNSSQGENLRYLDTFHSPLLPPLTTYAYPICTFPPRPSSNLTSIVKFS